MKIVTTLCIPHKNHRVLLGLKKRGFGMNRWNGFGGKVHAGESVEEAAVRETLEECGLRIKNPVAIGLLNFQIKSTGEHIEMHLFKVSDFENQETETEEMIPKWFDEDKIPFEDMWPDDKYWMPYFLRNQKFKAEFLFSDYDNIASHTIDELT